MHIRKHRYQEEAGDDGGKDGITGKHPAAGAGSDDDPGDSGDSGDSGDDKPGGLTAAAAARLAAGGDTGDTGDTGDEKTGRPADIPEQFWIAGEGDEPGKVNLEALTKSWKDTRTELKEAKGKVGSKAPEKPEDYTFTPPGETEVNYDNLAEDDPGMNAIRIAAQKAGLDQTQFQTLVEQFFENCSEALPEPFNEEAELAIVGKNGQAVLEANVRWCNDLMERGVISKQEYDEAMLMGATGYGVRFLAKVRAEATGELSIPLDAVQVDGALPSKAELHAMMGDPKYSNDPKFRADVDKKFELVYGNDPAGTSEANVGISHANMAPANIRRADEMRKKAQG